MGGTSAGRNGAESRRNLSTLREAAGLSAGYRVTRLVLGEA